MKLRQLGLALAVALPILAGCRADEELNAPNLAANDSLFLRYVAMGNSITAGWQSGGINDSTQLESYAVLLARRAGRPVGAGFFVPLLNRPGCPAPYVQNTTNPPTRLSNVPCALRTGTNIPFVSNVAVPGAHVADLLDNAAGSANALTTFILGGRTQVQAMQQANPTFVSLWIGNNDVLGSLTSSANPGDPALITSADAFQTAYGRIVDSIAAVNPKGAILIGVANVTAIPYTTPGAVYWCLKTGACPGVPANPVLQGIPTLQVANSCAPAATGVPGAQGDATLVPWTVALTKLATAQAGVVATIDCTVDTEVVLPSETVGLQTAVAGYNQFIAAQADQHGWAYFDPNPTLLAARAAATTDSIVRVTLVPCLPPLPTTPPTPLACGKTVNATPNVTFGTWFSLDGVHPSGTAHRVIADSIAAVINRKYGTSLATNL